jgi:drug/metabolite transporter (DMT)-like permease
MQAVPIAHPDDYHTTSNVPPLAYATAVLCWFLSAGVYIAAKWVSPEMPPWALCFWRLALACTMLLPFVRSDYAAMGRLIRTRWLEVLFIGAIGMTFCQGMIYTGLNYTDATTAGIIMALSPMLTMVLARVLLNEPLGIYKGIGAALALTGVLVIIARGDIAALLGLQLNPGELWIVGSAFCWALYTVLQRRAGFGIGLLPLVVILLGAGALAALPFYVWEIFSDDRFALHVNGLLALFYVAGPGGAVMYYLYNRSVDMLGAGPASMLLYLQTIFVAVLAYFFLNESLHDYDLVGAGFIVVGLLVTNLMKTKRRQEIS